MSWRMKKTGLVIAVLSLGVWAPGCSSGDNGPKGGTIDACALLAEVNPGALLGEPVGEGKKSIDRNDAEAIVSICSFSAKNDWKKTVSLQIMYAKNDSNPKTAAEYLKGKDFESVGLKKPTEVPGLGDVALSISMPGSQVLQVFWKKHYRMKVSITGSGDLARALEKAKSVARLVMDKL